MCDVAITLAGLAVATAATSAGMQAYGSYQQGKFQSEMAEYQRSMEIQRAAETQEQAGREAMEAAQRRRLQVGAGRVAAAGGGAMLDASPLDAVSMWERDNAYMGAYETEKIRRDAELAEWGFLSSASTLRAGGKAARWAGNMGAGGAIVGGIGSVAGAAAAGYGQYKTGQRLDALENANWDYSSVQN